MRILRICYEYPPPWAGLTPGPFELTRAQANDGHQIRYLCRGWPRRPSEPVENVRVRRLPSALPKLHLFATTSVAAFPFALAWQNWADVIHGHGHLAIYYHLWRRLFGGKTPYVLHLHTAMAGRHARDIAQAQQMGFWLRRWERPLHILSDKVGCQIADAVICVSESVREQALEHYGVAPEKVHVVTNGVNTELFSAEGDNLREQFGFAPDDRIIMFAGIIRSVKRPELLLNALNHLPPQWKVLFVGNGPSVPMLQASAEAQGLAERVHFTGLIPYRELGAYYRSADIFAMSSIYEGFPKVVLEALACGVPVITTPSFTVSTDLQPYVQLIEDVSPEGIAKSAERTFGLKVDTDLIEREYSWRKKVADIAAIYRQIGVSVDG
ncbi:MAG: glycosyltransferase family 4 protein [Candidatus Promineifilaceae bacterium]